MFFSFAYYKENLLSSLSIRCGDQFFYTMIY